MAFKRKEVTGYDLKIIDNTYVDILEKTIVIKSIDNKENIINYVIPKESFIKYSEIISNNFKQKKILNIEEIQQILFMDIYKEYKKKNATINIIYCIMNILIKENLIKTENCIDYELVVHNELLDNYIINFCL